MDIKNRIGRFTLSREQVESKYEAVRKIMSECVIVRCELMFYGGFEYMALSEHFDIAPEGEEAPLYTVTVYGDGRVIFERL